MKNSPLQILLLLLAGCTTQFSEPDAVNGSTGDVLWESGPYNLSTATPLYGFGKVILGLRQTGSVMHAFDPGTGLLDWTVFGMSLTQRNVPPDAASDQQVPNRLIVAQAADLYALSPEDGQVHWHESIGFNHAEGATSRRPLPVTWGEFVLHIEGQNRLVMRSLETGDEVWDYTLDDSSYGSPMVGGNTVYITTMAG